MIWITSHFAYEEAMQRKWYGGPAVPYPTQWVKDRLTLLYEQMEIIRAIWRVPIHLSSVYRSPAFNTAIDGKPKSQHMAGRACDFVVKGISADEVHRTVMRMIEEEQLQYIKGIGKYPRFTHIDIRPTIRLATWDETRRSNIPKAT